jgi:hypothetical protein
MNRSRALRALAAVALGAALTGCMKIDMSLDINEDETVDGHVIIGITEELAALSGEDPEDLVEEMRADLLEDAPEGVTEEPYEDDEFQGSRMVMDGVPLEEFDFDDDETLSIVHEDGEYRVSGVLDLTGAEEFGELSEEEQRLLDVGGASMEVRVAITFPGDVIEHNGELDGRTVTWEPEFGESVDIEALADDSGGSSFPWLVAGVVTGVLVIGALALLLLLRRREGAAEVPIATAGAPEGADATTRPVPTAGLDAPDWSTAPAPTATEQPWSEPDNDTPRAP